jgi:hypothetical protein
MQNGYEFNSLVFITAGGPVSIGVALIFGMRQIWELQLSKTTRLR